MSHYLVLIKCLHTIVFASVPLMTKCSYSEEVEDIQVLEMIYLLKLTNLNMSNVFYELLVH